MANHSGLALVGQQDCAVVEGQVRSLRHRLLAHTMTSSHGHILRAVTHYN